MAAENNNNIAPSKLTENDVDLHNITMPWPLKATVLPKEPILARVAIKEPLAIEILNVILRVDIVLPNNKTFNIGKDEKCRVLLDKNMDKDWRVFLFNVHLTTPFLLPGDYKVRYSVIIRDGRFDDYTVTSMDLQYVVRDAPGTPPFFNHDLF